MRAFDSWRQRLRLSSSRHSPSHQAAVRATRAWRGQSVEGKSQDCRLAVAGIHNGRVAEPVVLKEYHEELGEKDADGFYDYAYRYWVYWFDLDGRRYRVRIYIDEPSNASVMEMDAGRAREYEDDLRAIAGYLRREAGIRTVSALSSSGGFEPVISFE